MDSIEIDFCKPKNRFFNATLTYFKILTNTSIVGATNEQ